MIVALMLSCHLRIRFVITPQYCPASVVALRRDQQECEQAHAHEKLFLTFDHLKGGSVALIFEYLVNCVDGRFHSVSVGKKLCLGDHFPSSVVFVCASRLDRNIVLIAALSSARRMFLAEEFIELLLSDRVRVIGAAGRDAGRRIVLIRHGLKHRKSVRL
ncbi:hypothetical protein KC352_g57 [Hortaea werneckii]|nr:hypothetical protein KC352_g57 [Hortaea werneckii]